MAWEPGIQGGKVIGEHDGYTRLADPVLHRRTLELDAASRVFTIHDDIVAKGAHEIAVYFHLAEDAQVPREEANRYRIAVAGGTVGLEVDAHVTVETLKGSDEPIGAGSAVAIIARSPAPHSLPGAIAMVTVHSSAGSPSGSHRSSPEPALCLPRVR